MRLPNLLLCLIVVFCGATGPLSAQDNGLVVELNKFEDTDAGNCSTFFLFRNTTEKSFEEFEMSLAILNKFGVIDRLLTVDASPLPIARTTLKLFEIPDTECAEISEILLHAIDACRPQNEDNMDCFPIVQLVSKTTAGLVK